MIEFTHGGLAPITKGKMVTAGGTRIEAAYIGPAQGGLSFEVAIERPSGPYGYFCAGACREAAKFFNALAEDLEAR